MNKHPLILGFFATFLLTACGGGGDSSSSSGDTPGGPSLEELADKVKEAFCADATLCHRYESEADCKASTQIDIEQAKASIDAGKTKYNADKVDACVAALKSQVTCSATEQAASNNDMPLAPCDEVFIGTQADGAKCIADEECSSANCEIPQSCMTQCCEGACAKLPAPEQTAKVGESCVTLDCEDGAYCQTDDQFNPTTCAAQGKDGDTCADIDGCKYPVGCAIEPGMMMGVCKKPAAHGAACDTNVFFSACDALDDYCDMTTKVCTTYKLPGEACGDSAPCVYFADCAADGKCAKKGAEGAACDSMDFTSQCLGDLSCEANKCSFDPEVVCP